MATTEQEHQVKWNSGNDTWTVDDAANVERISDALDLTGISGAVIMAAAITCKADFTGATAADETVEFYLMRSMGDPDSDGGVTFEYPGEAGTDETAEGEHLCTLAAGDNDPGRKTVNLPVPLGKIKLYARSTNFDAAETATISAVIRSIKA